MWKRFKKRVNNWIFEEIDEENEVEETNHTIEKERRSPEAKMMYQYPKQTPFRFPVINDRHSNEKEHIPAYKRKDDFNLERKIEQTDTSIKLSRREVQRIEKMKNIQDIPAYIRRKRYEIKEELTESTEQQSKEQHIIPHTRPDELDAIFKKRDSDDKSENRENDNYIERNEREITDDFFHKTSNKTTYINEITSNLEKSNEDSKNINEYENVDISEQQYTTVKSNQSPLIVEHNGQQQHKEKSEIAAEKLVPKYELNSDIPLHLLDDPVEENRQEDEQWIQEQTYLLERTLKHFNVKAHVVNATQGSSVTRFEVKPEIGVKVSRIRNLTDDIKLNLAAKDIRIEAPIPGRHTVGIEVPNKNAYPVGLQEIVQTDVFNDNKSPLTIALGVTIEGEPLVTTVGKMPHCLIAGATGSGKSVCINTILLSLMYKASHNDVKFLLIDPKMVELAPYNGIPHLISPVITDVKAATASLKWAVTEMENRYELFAKSRVRDITRFNTKVMSGDIEEEKMPYIVIVIDELADLMMASPQDVEDAICRIAQKARACGIHLLLATQRPSVDVITGLIKANIPTRISFSVTSQVDSRTIIDTIGAEKLLGKGDMLFVENGASEIIRLQGPFVSDDEVERITAYVRSIAQPNYLFEQEQLLKETIQNEEEDDLLEDVIYFVIEHNQASTSLLQRRFRIGYNRAARLIDTLEARGIISEQNGTKPRDVLITKTQLEEL